jgi:hypothetical protein
MPFLLLFDMNSGNFPSSFAPGLSTVTRSSSFHSQHQGLSDWEFSEEPLASARGFFQRKSQFASVANGVQIPTAIHPQSSERGIWLFHVTRMRYGVKEIARLFLLRERNFFIQTEKN